MEKYQAFYDLSRH